MGSVLASLLMQRPTELPFRTQYGGVPKPTCLHRCLGPGDVGQRQVLIVGDVHGCFDELKQLLEKVGYTPQAFLLIFCGDIINKGPKNIETLTFIRNLGPHVHVIRGNHEERVIREWTAVERGALETFGQKYRWMTELSIKDMDYLINLPYTISIPHLSLKVVHAGLFQWKPLERQLPTNMITMRNIRGMDVLQPEATEKFNVGVPWASLYDGPDHVYFGHDARRRLQQYKFATGIDTGCLYGGSLTAVLATGSKKLVTVKARKCYIDPLAKPVTNPSLPAMENNPLTVTAS